MPEISNRSPEVKSTSGMKNTSANRKGAKLPWWVELLFVQLGLPDNWLPKLLKLKKSTNLLISDNASSIYYSVLLIISLTYFYPVVKQARLHNHCVTKTTIAISSGTVGRNAGIKDEATEAFILCNGSSE